MSYAEQYEVSMATLASAAVIGDKGSWGIGSGGGATVRRIAVVFHTEPTSTGTIKFDKTTAGGTRGDGDVGVLNIIAAHNIGEIVYKDVNVALAPGSVVTAEVTGAVTGATSVTLLMLVDPDWEAPAAVATMIAST